MIEILVAYKCRMYPTKEQGIYFAKTFGCVRFIYNKMLSDKNEYYKETKKKLNNTPAQYKKEFEWLKEVDAQALCNAQMNLQAAYSNFFKRPEVGFPKFKSRKNNHSSYTTNQCTIKVSNKYITLPKVGQVKIKKHRDFDGRIKKATISKSSSEKYYVSVLVEQKEKENLPVSNSKIGIDLGIKEFLITSDGEMIENPKYLRKSEKKLRKLQKDLSRCQKESSNRNKARIKVAKQHEKIANQRKDFLHKTSRKIANFYDVVCVEGLNMKAMSQTMNFGKSVHDNGWGNVHTYA